MNALSAIRALHKRSDDHVVADLDRMPGAATDQGVLHHDHVLRELDRAAVVTQHGAEQHAAPGSDPHVPAQHRRGRDPGGRVDGGAASEVLNQHGR